MIAANTSLTNVRMPGADLKLTVIACRGEPSGRNASTNTAASSTIATSASRNP